MQNVVGPTLVAMAMKFGLGTEIQSPTSLSFLLPDCHHGQSIDGKVVIVSFQHITILALL